MSQGRGPSYMEIREGLLHEAAFKPIYEWQEPVMQTSGGKAFQAEDIKYKILRQERRQIKEV